MTCPSCGQRRGRRHCPAIDAEICSICCGTKRLVEIQCPAHCPHLAAARAHPPAAVRRQQEQDLAELLPTIRHLTERQYELFFVFHSVIARHQPEGFARLLDEDVADAAGSLAATLETAARGVIYEHLPQLRAAQRLATELTRLLEEVRQKGAHVSDRDAAIALRAIERGARDMRTRHPEADTTAYLTLMTRLRQTPPPEAAPEPPKEPSPLILP